MNGQVVRRRYRNFMRKNYLGVSDLIFLGFLATAFIVIMFGLLSIILGDVPVNQAERECTQRGGTYIEEHCWRGELFLQPEEK